MVEVVVVDFWVCRWWWWILGLPLVVVEMGFGVAGFEEQKRKGTWVATIILCSVSGWAHHFWQKVELKTDIYE